MLDFHVLAIQLEQMLDDESLRPAQLFEAIEAAREVCASCDGAAFNDIVSRALESDDLPQGWHPARLFDDESQPSPQLCTAHAAPHTPQNLCVVAADGSQIYPDAHQIAGCYLVNLSAVKLRYDASTRDDTDNAQMSATPQLFGAADAWGDAAREVAGAINKEMVDARRHVLELSQLADSMNALPENEIAVGLCDGIFELRVSAAQPWRQFALDENERAMDALRLANQPVCGYIAAPRATDVVTALRLVMREKTPREYSQDENAPEKIAARDVLHNDVLPRDTTSREYSRGATSPSKGEAALSLLSDARLFDALLQSGERSAIFVTTRLVSQSQREYSPRNIARTSTNVSEGNAVAPSRYENAVSDESSSRENIAQGASFSHENNSVSTMRGAKPRAASTRVEAARENNSRHASCFCYLKIGDGQVVRLEFPRWVATRADWLDRLHAALLQQTERGDGYPVALMEAHEHAVVRASERELFYSLLEEMMMARGHNPQRSAKAVSKTRPLV